MCRIDVRQHIQTTDPKTNQSHHFRLSLGDAFQWIFFAGFLLTISIRTILAKIPLIIGGRRKAMELARRNEGRSALVPCCADFISNWSSFVFPRHMKIALHRGLCRWPIGPEDSRKKYHFLFRNKCSSTSSPSSLFTSRRTETEKIVKLPFKIPNIIGPVFLEFPNCRRFRNGEKKLRENH